MYKKVLFLFCLLFVFAAVIGKVYIGVVEKSDIVIEKRKNYYKPKQNEYEYLFLDKNDPSRNNLSRLNEMDSITSLVLWNFSYEEIKDIEMIPSLTEVEIWFSDIKGEIELLKSPYLKCITMNSCNVKVFDYDNTKTLEKLDLSYNDIENIDFLKEASSLVKLYICGNNIKDINPLTELEGLETLFMGFNPIENYESLSEMDWSNMKEVSISGLEFDKIYGFLPTDKSGLIGLGISNMDIEDLDFIHEFSNLEYLYMNNNRIKSLERVLNMERLEFLYARNNEVDEIDSYKMLKELKFVDLTGNPILKE